ncbi:putative phloem protein [Helianthus anomalus]
MFQKVAELLSTQVFRIKCKIKSKRLLQNMDYSCYLVFKLSKSCGLHCPVKVYDLHQSTNNHTKVVYFSPRGRGISIILIMFLERGKMNG